MLKRIIPEIDWKIWLLWTWFSKWDTSVVFRTDTLSLSYFKQGKESKGLDWRKINDCSCRWNTQRNHSLIFIDIMLHLIMIGGLLHLNFMTLMHRIKENEISSSKLMYYSVIILEIKSTIQFLFHVYVKKFRGSNSVIFSTVFATWEVLTKIVNSLQDYTPMNID